MTHPQSVLAAIAIAAAVTLSITACSGGLATVDQLPGRPLAVFVAPEGDDAADGSLPHPWRTLAHAFAQLRPGQVLNVRAGTYRERGLQLRNNAGTALPIVVRAMPGERVVVDGSIREFLDQPDSAWEALDAVRGIYRSKSAFADLRRCYGELPPYLGSQRLVPYVNYRAFAADLESYARDPYFVGPGVFWDSGDQHVYARLQGSLWKESIARSQHADATPQTTPLALFGTGSLIQIAAGSRRVELEGLTLRGAEFAIEMLPGCSGIRVADCDLRAGRYEILVRSPADNVRFEHLLVDGRIGPWLARSDVKADGSNAPAHYLQGSALQLEGNVDRVQITGCRFSRLFDAIDTNGAPTNFDVHDNEFYDLLDDAFEVASAGHHVHFHDNRVLDAGAAVSWTGSTGPPPSAAGTKYIHHNVIDTSRPLFYARSDPLGLLPPSWHGPGGDGRATGRPFNSHDADGMTSPDPWKIYRNTIVGARDVDDGGLGLAYRFGVFDAANPHEVLDNILVVNGDSWITVRARTADGSQVFDGNVWFRARSGAAAPLLSTIDSQGHDHGFAALGQFLTSPEQRATQNHYPPGWEAGGSEADPQLDADYRPSRTGPAVGQGVDLSGRGWPGADAQPYRGALPPR